jgi:hypothetical protein
VNTVCFTTGLDHRSSQRSKIQHRAGNSSKISSLLRTEEEQVREEREMNSKEGKGTNKRQRLEEEQPDSQIQWT